MRTYSQTLKNQLKPTKNRMDEQVDNELTANDNEIKLKPSKVNTRDIRP